MTTSASALPALAPNDEGRKVVERMNALIRFYNRPDLFVPSYAPDMGSGAAYVMAPSADVKVYEVGQKFSFKATTANTVTNPTLNVQGLGAGTITKNGGAALAIGDIAANSFPEVIVASTTPTFELISPSAVAPPITNSGATTFLGADVALNNASNFFNGPNTGSIGASGQTWQITAVGTVASTAAATTMEIAIFDGSAYVAASTAVTPTTSQSEVVTVTAVVTLSAATTFTLRAKANSTSASLQTTGLSTAIANKATSITAVRLA